MKNESTLSGLTVANFSKQIDGKETMLCILTNNKGAELTITNYGAKIVSLMVPDRSGKLTDVVTGHNSIDEYLVSEEPYFEAVKKAEKDLAEVTIADDMATVSQAENSHWMALCTINWLSIMGRTACMVV